MTRTVRRRRKGDPEHEAKVRRILARHRQRDEARTDIFGEIGRGDYIEFIDRRGRTRLMFVLAKYPDQRELYGQVVSVGGWGGDKLHITADQVMGFWPTAKHHRGDPPRTDESTKGGQFVAAAPRAPMSRQRQESAV